MAKPAFRIKPYKHLRYKFVVRSNVTGKWKRKFFLSRQQAETYVRLKNTALLNQGVEGVTFSSELRVMAQREEARLAPFGKTLTDAADFYIEHLKMTERSVPVRQAICELKNNQGGRNLSRRYQQESHYKLQRFCRDFGERAISDITTAEIDEWLQGLRLLPNSRNTYRRDLNVLFSFAMTRRYCAFNPVLRAATAKQIDDEVGILSVDQVTCLLEAAPASMVPFFAIGAFAGLRTSEIHQLDWSHINFQSKPPHIRVEARRTKSAARRTVDIKPNLRLWIETHALPQGSIRPPGFRRLFDETRRQCGLAKSWPPNALRHSFASYHLAAFENKHALAQQMGNSPEMIDAHYRRVVLRQEAAKYWKIVPPPL